MDSTSTGTKTQKTRKVVNCARYSGGQWQSHSGVLPTEIKLCIFINEEPCVDIMCTPKKLDCLVIGFLRGEGFIEKIDDIESMRFHLGESVADVRLSKPRAERAMRRIKTSGLGGGPSFESGADLTALSSSWSVTPAQVAYAVSLLTEGNGGKRPGMHVSAVTDGKKLVARSEDIGRHNTIDRIRGELMLAGKPTKDLMLSTTGRISSEMLLKAANMEMPIVVSLNSVTSHAVKFANELGVTVVGHAREEEFMVYSHPERIAGCPNI